MTMMPDSPVVSRTFLPIKFGKDLLDEGMRRLAVQLPEAETIQLTKHG